MRKKTEKIECEVILTDRELLDYGQKLATTTREIERERLHLKEVMARSNALIKSGEMQGSEYINKIERKSERRYVQCTIEYDWETHVKRWRRCDTLEIEKEDIIEEHELQEEADLQAADQQRPTFPTDVPAASTIGEAVEEKARVKKSRKRKVDEDAPEEDLADRSADFDETQALPDPEDDIAVGEGPQE